MVRAQPILILFIASLLSIWSLATEIPSPNGAPSLEISRESITRNPSSPLGALHALEMQGAISIDGVLSDWDGIDATAIISSSTTDNPGSNGEKDLTASLYLSWDQDNLYLAVKTVDDIFTRAGRSSTGDQIQIRLESDQGDVFAYSLALHNMDSVLKCVQHPASSKKKVRKDIKSAVKRVAATRRERIRRESPGGCIYELQLPWSELGSFAPFTGAEMQLNLSVTDIDGKEKSNTLRLEVGKSNAPGRRIFFEPVPPLSNEPFEFFAKGNPGFIGDDDAWELSYAINAAVVNPVRNLAIEVSKDRTSIISLTQRVRYVAGLTRYRELWRLKGLKEGSYTVSLRLTNANQTVLSERKFPVFKYDSTQLKIRSKQLATSLESALAAKTQAASRHGASLVWHLREIEKQLGERITPESLKTIRQQMAALENHISIMANNQDPLAGERGLVTRAYHSPVDGTLQPYLVFVPLSYRGRNPWPTIVGLHGRYANAWQIPRVLGVMDDPRKIPYIMVFPNGRGDTFYRGLGEDDAWTVLNLARRDYKINNDRLHLTGLSMGGEGTWRLALQNPHVFAGVAPFCARSLPHLAPNAGGMNLYFAHGGADRVVSSMESILMADRLKAAGFKPKYSIIKNGKHNIWDMTMPNVLTFFSTAKKDHNPRRVTYVTDRLRYNRGYWVEIMGFISIYQQARIDAQFTAENTLSVTAENVSRLRLHLDSKLVDIAQPVVVSVNGIERFRAKTEGMVDLLLSGEPVGKRVKRPGISGPMCDIFHGSLLLVVGTASSDEKAVAINFEEAEKSSEVWNKRFGAKLIIKKDSDITDEDIAKSHLILFGGPGSNSITARIASDLPVRIRRNAIQVGKRRFKGKDIGVRFIYPNPENPNRYVMVVAGSTPQGMAGGWKTLHSRHDPDQLPWADIMVYDSHAKDGSLPTYLLIDAFDSNWQYQPSPVVGKLATALPHRGLDGPRANMVADAIRIAASADLAFVDRKGWLSSLPKGEITRAELLAGMDANEPILLFKMHGVEVMKQALELQVINYGDDKGDNQSYPLQVSGMSYAFDPKTKPHVVFDDLELELNKVYTVAAPARLVKYFWKFFLAQQGRSLGHSDTGITVQQALEDYVKMGTEASQASRLRRK
jgi:5'-nucleotidase, C-terminal domain